MTDSQTPKVFRFADLELDDGQQCVLRNGIHVRLPKLSFDLLLVLLESAPNYVSNKQLMERVWPGLVIAEKTVSQRVKLLRDALGDDREQPLYVAGLRGRGYRIASPVIRVDRNPGAAADSRRGPANKEPPKAHRTRWPAAAERLVPGTIAGLLLVVLAWSLWGVSPGIEEIGAIGDGASGNNEQAGISVAVLPFRDLSGSETEDFIALGVPEMVLDKLSTVPGLSVIARSSSFRAKDNHQSVRDIGLQLGARYLIDGSVQRAGDTLRISTQLIDAQAGTQIWAERFDVTSTTSSQSRIRSRPGSPPHSAPASQNPDAGQRVGGPLPILTRISPTSGDG